MTVSTPRSLASRGWLIAVALLVGTLLLFSRSLTCDFINYDDQDYVTRNVHVKDGLTIESVRWAFTSEVAANWHPLTWLTHELDSTLYGSNPAGHHATNILIHAITAALVFLTLRRLTGAVWTAAFCAALWAWHPLRVESVTWIAERKDVLGAFFWFATLWSWTGYVKSRSDRAPHAWRWYAGSLLTFILGLLSKPMLVTLPCVLLLLDFWPLRRTPWSEFAAPSPNATPDQKDRAKAKPAATPTDGPPPSPAPLNVLVGEKLPFFLLSAISCRITYFAQQSGGAISTVIPFGTRLANAFTSIPRYFGKFLWPADLAVLYPHHGYVPVGSTILAVVFVVVLTAVVLQQWRRRPWLAVGWFWFVGTLIPVLGLVQVGLQSMADRYTYLPIIGVQLAALWTLREFATSPAIRRGFGFGAGLVLFACVLVTWNEQSVWKDSFTLFSRALQVTEGNYLAWNNLGTCLSEKKQYAESIPYYRESLAIKPDYDSANNNLGHALAETGNLPEAMKHYRLALQTSPSLLAAHRNYGNALADSGKPEEALGHYRFALDRNPEDEDALNGCGMALALLNRFAESEKMFRDALALPRAEKRADTRTNLATLYAMSGRFAEAAREYRTLLESSPNEAQVHNNLANVLVSQKAPAEAIEHYRRAIELRPRNPEAHSNLGLALVQLKRYEEARKELQIALQQQPDLPQARATLQQLETLLPAK